MLLLDFLSVKVLSVKPLSVYTIHFTLILFENSGFLVDNDMKNKGSSVYYKFKEHFIDGAFYLMGYNTFLIIGGSRGVGNDILKHFKGDNVSRSSGYDITDPITRKKIAQKSLDYDVIVNHAYSRDFSQTYLLKELCFLWQEKKKKGYIINTGSVSSYRFYSGKDEKWSFYSATKASSDQFINHFSHIVVRGNEVKFRITNVRLGMLDSEKDRKKPHFKAGVKGKDYCQLIEYLLSTPENMIISEITMEAKCP